jgi:hypothetical protein
VDNHHFGVLVFVTTVVSKGFISPLFTLPIHCLFRYRKIMDHFGSVADRSREFSVFLGKQRVSVAFVELKFRNIIV